MGFFGFDDKKRIPTQEELHYQSQMGIQEQKKERAHKAKQKLDHYLSSSFTRECAALIKRKSESLLASPTFNGMYATHEIQHDRIMWDVHTILTFRECGYNSLPSEADVDAFALAIATILGKGYEVEFYVPSDREYDWNRTYIKCTTVKRLKDI